MAKASEKLVLVVDDEPDIRNFLSACISDAGFMVETASDGIEAMEKIALRTPDLITLDMVMPRKAGIRVMRELKTRPEWARIPVIVITAHAKDEFGEKYMSELNAIATRMQPRYAFEKPVTPEKLVKAICEILDVEAVPKSEKATDMYDVLRLLEESDHETLEQIKKILASKKPGRT